MTTEEHSEGYLARKRRHLETAHVLTGCRRLQKRGLIEEVSTSYVVMLFWSITDAGRRALEGQGND